jgi:hypothetical protein
MGRTRRAKKQNGVHTIRELRTSFEHMEEYTKSVAETSTSKDGKIKLIRSEWQKVFFKPLARESAAALLEEHSTHKGRRRTRKRGGAMALSGAPVEHMTRPGLYLAPGHIPNADGGLALSGQSGGASPYGSFIEYIDHGFGNPEIAESRPADWPSPAANMGSNRVGGGKKGRRVRRGGGVFNPIGDIFRPIVDEALSRPFSSSAPSSPLQDAQIAWKGQQHSLNPDQSHRSLSYQTI